MSQLNWLRLEGWLWCLASTLTDAQPLSMGLAVVAFMHFAIGLWSCFHENHRAID